MCLPHQTPFVVQRDDQGRPVLHPVVHHGDQTLAREVVVTDTTIDVRDLMARIAGGLTSVSDAALMSGTVVFEEHQRRYIVAHWTTTAYEDIREPTVVFEFPDRPDVQLQGVDLHMAVVLVEEPA